MKSQIASVIEEAWAAEYTYIGIIVDLEAIRKLQVGARKILVCFTHYFLA